MNKTLITLLAAGTLAVPAGLALAQGDTVEPTAPATTYEQHERARDRVSRLDPAAEHGRHRAEYQFGFGEGTGAQVRTRDQIRDRDGTGTCVDDCTGDQTRDQTRDQIRDRDGTGTCDQIRDQDRTGQGNS